MRSDVKKDYLQSIFKYPVPCYGCLDGPGHLAGHLLCLANDVSVDREGMLFSKISLKWRYMNLILAIILPSDHETVSLANYFPEAEERVLRTLERDTREILSSQFHLMVLIWNTSEQLTLEDPVDIGAILIGVQKALQLPYDSRSTAILVPLSLKIARLIDVSSAGGRGTFAERDVVKEEANTTRRLVLTTLAVRLIFGQYNGRLIACARTVGDDQPAVSWLKPYEG
jgi:hypothetical protein